MANIRPYIYIYIYYTVHEPDESIYAFMKLDG